MLKQKETKKSRVKEKAKTKEKASREKDKVTKGKTTKIKKDKNINKKEQKNRNNKKKNAGLIVKILAMSIIPVLALGIILAAYSNNILTNSLENRVEEELTNSAIALEKMYSEGITGSYLQSPNGDVYKGMTKITGNTTMIDSFKERTGIDCTIIFNDTRVATTVENASGERITGTTVSAELVETVVTNGEDYFGNDIVIDGEHYYGAYIPLVEATGNAKGMMFCGIKSESVHNLVYSETVKIFMVAIVVMLIAVFVSIVIGQRMVKSLNNSMIVLEKVSKGDLTIPSNMKRMTRQDEIGEIFRYVEKLREELKGIIGNIQNAVGRLSKASLALESTTNTTRHNTEELTYAIEEIAKGASMLADETETATESIEKIGEMIKHIVGDVSGLTRNAKQMDAAGNEAAHIIGELNASNDKTIEAINRIAEQTKTTNDSAQQIRQAVNFISSIAEETNLLSLNASIEAARAGEAGKGFAVVANQIQKLAEQSNESASRIEDIITVLLEDSRRTVATMDEVLQIVAEQQDKLEQTRDKFLDVSKGITTSLKAIDGISNRTQTLDESRASIVDVVANLSAVSEENAASTEETNASAEELNSTVIELADAAKELKSIADILQKDIEFFNI